MTDQSAPQGVNLLKELLFDRETRRLDDLGRRLDAETERVTQWQKDLSGRVEAVYERAGSEEKLQHSVAEIIDKSLQEAEKTRHEPLSRAIAPLVVKTIKFELKENQDEMVEALFPITGRMVKSYVQAAINDLMVQINAKLGGARPAKLAEQSAATGASMAELALAEANTLEIQELFLLRRGSGELVAHWERPEIGSAPVTAERPGAGNRDVLIAGYISGIMSLSEEAFGAKPGSFRTLTLENGERIFVRGSAAHLLALRCKGSAPAEVEQAIDEVFVETLDRYQKVLAVDATRRRLAASANGAGGVNARDLQRQTDQDVQKLLPDVARGMDERTAIRRTALEQKQQAGTALTAGPSFARLYALAALILLPLIGWGIWTAYQAVGSYLTETAAQRALAPIGEIRGVPPRVEVERGGGALTISGLVPDGSVRERIIANLGREAPGVAVRNLLGVLPAGSDDAIKALREDFEKRQAEAAYAGLARAMRRVEQRVSPLRSEVERLALAADATVRPALEELQRSLNEAADAVGTVITAAGRNGVRTPETARALDGLDKAIAAADAKLAAVLGTDQSAPLAGNVQSDDTVLAAEDAALAMERLSGAELGLAQALKLRAIPQRVETLADKVDRLKPRTAREEFESVVRSTAVFFDADTQFRDGPAANAALDQLARGLRENTDVVLRIVGYTDERGGQAINTGLAQLRADRIVEALAGRGIATNRLVAVGRLAGKDLTRVTGNGSANRRVEFEIGFPGETGGP